MLKVAALLLVAVNLIPLCGVLFFGWSLFSIMLLYWVENGIIGFFNVFKIAMASAPSSADTRLTINGRLASSWNRAFLIPFFILHYGIFWTVHAVFVIALFGVSGGAFSSVPVSGFRGFDPAGVAIAAASLFLSHGVSFFANFLGKEEYLNVSPQQQMFEPYPRVVVLHVTILGGAFLAAYLGTPLASLVVLVLLKIVIDLQAHLREHRRVEKRPGAADPAAG